MEKIESNEGSQGKPEKFEGKDRRGVFSVLSDRLRGIRDKLKGVKSERKDPYLDFQETKVVREILTTVQADGPIVATGEEIKHIGNWRGAVSTPSVVADVGAMNDLQKILFDLDIKDSGKDLEGILADKDRIVRPDISPASSSGNFASPAKDIGTLSQDNSLALTHVTTISPSDSVGRQEIKTSPYIVTTQPKTILRNTVAHSPSSFGRGGIEESLQPKRQNGVPETTDTVLRQEGEHYPLATVNALVDRPLQEVRVDNLAESGVPKTTDITLKQDGEQYPVDTVTNNIFKPPKEIHLGNLVEFDGVYVPEDEANRLKDEKDRLGNIKSLGVSNGTPASQELTLEPIQKNNTQDTTLLNLDGDIRKKQIDEVDKILRAFQARNKLKVDTVPDPHTPLQFVPDDTKYTIVKTLSAQERNKGETGTTASTHESLDIDLTKMEADAINSSSKNPVKYDSFSNMSYNSVSYNNKIVKQAVPTVGSHRLVTQKSPMKGPPSHLSNFPILTDVISPEELRRRRGLASNESPYERKGVEGEPLPVPNLAEVMNEREKNMEEVRAKLENRKGKSLENLKRFGLKNLTRTLELFGKAGPKTRLFAGASFAAAAFMTGGATVALGLAFSATSFASDIYKRNMAKIQAKEDKNKQELGGRYVDLNPQQLEEKKHKAAVRAMLFGAAAAAGSYGVFSQLIPAIFDGISHTFSGSHAPSVVPSAPTVTLTPDIVPDITPPAPVVTPDVAPIVTPEAPIVAQLVPVEQVIQPAAPVEAVRYQDIAGDIQKIADKVARDTRIASGMYGPSGDL